MLTIGSLFSGIGGLEIGLERTGKFRTIWQSEIDPWASAVLKKHWPGVENLGDITKIDWEKVQRPDLICGGFPCQDISQAGRQAGIRAGKRSGLWSEYAKALRILRPKYALVENVPALAYLGLDVVLADLAEIGYDAEWEIISAADVGAPHLRERIFIVAYLHGQRLLHGPDGLDTAETEQPALSDAGAEGSMANPQNNGQPRSGPARTWRAGLEDGGFMADTPCNGIEEPARQDRQPKPRGFGEGRMDALGESPTLAQRKNAGDFGREREPRDDSEHGEGRIIGGEGSDRDAGSETLADTNAPRMERREKTRIFEESRANGLQLARRRNQGDGGCWKSDAGVLRVAHGISNRIHRIKCCGNAVVPQVAQIIGEWIAEAEGAVI